MAKIFSVVTKAGVVRAFDPVARALLRAGVSPDAVTVIGTTGVVVASLTLATRGYLWIAALVITAFALTDILDGAMARARGTTSRFGALLDSTMDRIADGAVFGSLAYWLAVTDQRANLTACLICLIAGQVVSYVKARAESLGLDANVGIAERFERLIIIGIGGILDGLGVKIGLAIALWLLAVLSVVTVVQRMRRARGSDKVAV
jgi:CDP-diacylglycerol--glycerol-3-phosphate 3-phosphatidyltransferase